MVEHVVNLIHAHVLMDGRDPYVIPVSTNAINYLLAFINYK